MQRSNENKADNGPHAHSKRGRRLRMIESLILVVLLIIGVMVFVLEINSSLRDDTESSIKSMTKIGADYIAEYAGEDRRTLEDRAELIALLPKEERLEKMRSYGQKDVFSRMALVYADGSGYLNDGQPITA